MQHVEKGVRGLNLLVDLNLDRFFYSGAIFVALGAASQIAGFLG